MGGRFAGMLGWAGMTIVGGGVVLAVVRLAGVGSQAAEDFGVPVVLLLFLAFMVPVVRINIRRDRGSAPADDEDQGSAAGLVLRFLVAATAVGLAWWAFPTHFVSSYVPEGGLHLTEAFGVWGALGAVVLGLVLLVFAPVTASGGGWKALFGGLAAGASALVMITALTPVLTTWVEIEHRVATAGEPAPIPTDVTRVGWTWEPEESVHEIRRGLRGPVVRYGAGFVGLDGATGEELWTYRRSHSEILGAGFVPGDEAHVYLLYREGRARPSTILVLDTATGEVVREGPLPEHEDAQSWWRHVNADRMMGVEEDDEGGSVVGYDLDSAEPEWEYPLTRETGRVCLPGESVRTRLYGDRLLVSRTCLDEVHLDEGVLEGGEIELMKALDRLGRPDDAERVLVVLDTTTGDELWRAEVEPSRRLAWDDADVVRPRTWSDGDPVVVAGERLFGLNTGEPVDVVPDHPEQEYHPYERAPGTLAADTEGAVVAQEDPEALGPRLLKKSDSDGEVVSGFEVEWGIGRYLDGPTAVLEGALVSAVDAPRTSEAEDAGIEEGERAVLAIPLEDTDTDRAGTPRWIRFDGERLFDPDHGSGNTRHFVVATPGAVVAYVEDGHLGGGPPPVHGLVP